MESRTQGSKVLYAVTLPRGIDILSHALQGEGPPRTEQEARASPHGRPPHALLTFGFGGRAVLLRLRPAGGIAQSGENKSLDEQSSLRGSAMGTPLLQSLGTLIYSARWVHEDVIFPDGNACISVHSFAE